MVPNDERQTRTFQKLIEEEHEQIERAKGGNAAFEGTPNDGKISGEPWLAKTQHDRVGLALSGGGIRSATFNLGLLQALARLGVLRHVDYLSTVSGGGYLGGFWTAWRYFKKGAGIFPSNDGESAQAGKKHEERSEVRHMREFSRFLSPRIGVNEPELWYAAAAVLGGMLPALVATIAAIALAVFLWIGIGWLAEGPGFGAMLVFAVVTLALHAWREVKAKHDQRSEPPPNPLRWTVAYWTSAILSMGGVMLVASAFHAKWAPVHWGWEGTRFVTFGIEAVVAWFALAIIIPVLWVIVEGLARAWEWQFNREKVGSDELRGRRLRRTELRDKLASRYLSWALCAGVIVGIWEFAFWMDRTTTKAAIDAGLAKSGGLAAVFAGLFAWLRKWLSRSDKEETGGGFVTKAKHFLKDSIPAILATAGAFFLIVFAILLVRHLALSPEAATCGSTIAMGVLIAGGGVLVALKFFDPAYFGLHDFYRSRIARAYLGAVTAGDAPRRYTGEREVDDIRLTKLEDDVRPIHLICCAANHLTGDALPNLYRGGRSAVLSRFGISVGEHSFQPGKYDPPLMLSAAQTASAAAFNSQMGEKSIRLGRGSSFLMTALNLRLGLWVQNPAVMGKKMEKEKKKEEQEKKVKEEKKGNAAPSTEPEKKPNCMIQWWRGALPALLHFPGVAFFRELAGASRCLPNDTDSQIHLSDGGHFENLGLYELVRRHCTYVIASDAGQDENVAFDDLGNAIRRIREDFGVEIEIDLDPIRPNANLISSQHVVVGTIHYDGFEGSDKGILIYIKPTLTGDEPGDIQQYRTRNLQFPHESTGDQFFSEAQWESYRRLGEHIGQVAFRFVSELGKEQCDAPETIFWRARSVWMALPAGYAENFHEFNDQARALDSDILHQAPEALRLEFFPEVRTSGAREADQPEHDDMSTVFYLMRVLVLLEGAWLGLSLNQFWGHPMNEGWISYFHRWASMPSFRRWWPILSPLFSIDFREFMKGRFDLRLRDPEARKSDAGLPGPRLSLEAEDSETIVTEGHAWRMLERSAKGGAIARKHAYFGPEFKRLQYFLQLESETGSAPLRIQVGILFYRLEVRNDARIARWDSDAFFVPAPNSGAGIVGRFLDRVIGKLRKDDMHAIEVNLNTHQGSDPVSRALRLRTIEFYKSRLFHVQDNGGEMPVLRLIL